MKIDEAKLRKPEKKSEGFAPKRLSAFSDSTRSEIVYLDIEVLAPYRKQARQFFHDESIDQLAATIKEHGVRQPLTVIKRNSEEPYFEVVSGERRLRASKIAGLNRVPCIIITDWEKAEEIALIENIQRQDLHPVELANAISSLAENRGWGGQAEVAKKLGMGASQVSELLKLRKLDKDIQDSLISHNLRGRDVLRKLCSMHSDREQKLYIGMLMEEKRELPWKEVRSAAVRKESVLRVFMEGDEVSLQSAKLKNLTFDQRQALAHSLEALLEELRG